MNTFLDAFPYPWSTSQRNIFQYLGFSCKKTTTMMAHWGLIVAETRVNWNIFSKLFAANSIHILCFDEEKGQVISGKIKSENFLSV